MAPTPPINPSIEPSAISELAGLLAAAYLRFLRVQSAKRREQAHLAGVDSTSIELLSPAPEVMN
jgi:hypothetical protein